MKTKKEFKKWHDEVFSDEVSGLFNTHESELIKMGASCAWDYRQVEIDLLENQIEELLKDKK